MKIKKIIIEDSAGSEARPTSNADIAASGARGGRWPWKAAKPFHTAIWRGLARLFTMRCTRHLSEGCAS